MYFQPLQKSIFKCIRRQAVAAQGRLVPKTSHQDPIEARLWCSCRSRRDESIDVGIARPKRTRRTLFISDSRLRRFRSVGRCAKPHLTIDPTQMTAPVLFTSSWYLQSVDVTETLQNIQPVSTSSKQSHFKSSRSTQERQELPTLPFPLFFFLQPNLQQSQKFNQSFSSFPILRSFYFPFFGLKKKRTGPLYTDVRKWFMMLR